MHRVASIFAFSFAACGLAGCKAHDDAATQERDLPRLQTTWDDKPMQYEQKPVSVKEGITPLAHIFDVGGPVHVMDTTAKIRIAQGVVAGGTLVRIDDRHGVIFGKDTITPGPLPAGHRYAIFADPTTDNVFRRGVGPPPRIDQPSAPPAQTPNQ